MLGGYPTFQDALDDLKKSNNLEEKHQVLTEAVKHLFNVMGAEDVLHRNMETGLLEFRGRPMTDTDEQMLRAEAKVFESSRLWRMLRADVKYQLNIKMFENPNTQNELLWGKLLLFLDSVIDNRLKQLKK